MSLLSLFKAPKVRRTRSPVCQAEAAEFTDFAFPDLTGDTLVDSEPDSIGSTAGSRAGSIGSILEGVGLQGRRRNCVVPLCAGMAPEAPGPSSTDGSPAVHGPCSLPSVHAGTPSTSPKPLPPCTAGAGVGPAPCGAGRSLVPPLHSLQPLRDGGGRRMSCDARQSPPHLPHAASFASLHETPQTLCRLRRPRPLALQPDGSPTSRTSPAPSSAPLPPPSSRPASGPSSCSLSAGESDEDEEEEEEEVVPPLGRCPTAAEHLSAGGPPPRRRKQQYIFVIRR